MIRTRGAEGDGKHADQTSKGAAVRGAWERAFTGNAFEALRPLP